MTSNVYNALQAIKSIVDLDLIPNFSQMLQNDPLLPIHIDDAIVKLNNITTQLGAISTSPSLVYEYIVTDSKASSITVSNLDINLDKGYRVEIDLINGGSTLINFYMYVNGDLLATNYSTQSLYSSAASTTSYTTSNALLAMCEYNSRCTIVSNLKLSNHNYYRWSCSCLRGTLLVPSSHKIDGIKKDQISNINSLTFVSSQSLSIDIGTRIRIFREDY